MKKLLLFVVSALLLASLSAQAQNMRVRGTITSLDGDVLSVKTREGKDVKIELADRVVVAAVQPVKLADIKAGDGVGATTKPGPGGTLTGLEVHVFPANMAIPNEGPRPWDLEPGSR